MRPTFFLGTVSVFLLLVGSSGAHHCATWSTADHEFEQVGFYVDNDLCQTCIFSIWIYQESNGIPGLQRADDMRDDTCHGMIASDTLIF